MVNHTARNSCIINRFKPDLEIFLYKFNIVKYMGKILASLFLILLFLNIVCAQKIYETETKIAGVKQTEAGLEGILADLYVEIHNGTGRVFVDTMPLTQIDTQASARLAQEVACDVLEIDCSKYNFLYTIRSIAPIIGGPSAGGAMAAATISALINKTINNTVMMTGTINPDGSVGAVGGILEKAEAAYKGGAAIFLIPKGLSKVYITERKTGGGPGWVSIEEVLKEINVKDYALENWGLEVIEVINVQEASKYLTGYEIIEKKVTSAEIASEEYEDAMEEMAGYLSEYAKKILNRAKTKKEETTLGAQYSNLVESVVSEQETTISNADDLYNNKQYYSAASYYVRASIGLNFVSDFIDFTENQENLKTWTKDLIENTLGKIYGVEGNISKLKKMDSLYDIEALTVAFDRLREAQDLIEEAYREYYSENYEMAVQYASYADVRKETALLWANITERFKGNKTIEFDASKLESLARKRLEESMNSITYASTVTANMFLLEAEQFQLKAEAAFQEKKYVFALFSALQARAEANLAMEVRDVPETEVKSKLQEKKDDASYYISKAEESGLLPILAISYLEYTKEFEETDLPSAFKYAAWSKEFAKITKDVAKTMHEEVEIKEEIKIKPAVLPKAKEKSNYMYELVAAFLIGFCFGALIISKLIK